MTREQLDEIIIGAGPEFQRQLGELFEHILSASAQALEDDDNDKPKVSVGLKLVIALNTKTPTWHVEGAVSVRHKTVGEQHETKDPNQPELLPS